jgi:transposase InsO family protein
MTTDFKIISYVKRVRDERGYLGKEKLKPFVDRFCLENNLKTISSSTIGKIIKRYCLKKPKRIYHNINHNHKKLYNRYKTKVKRSPKINKPGYIEIDTIVKFVCGIKLYILSAIDIYSKFCFSYGYTRLNSSNSLDFIKKLELVYPIQNGIKIIQTDNGLEFMGEFDSYLKRKNINHLFIYPRCPKINGFVERVNRTLQDEFIDDNQDLALESIDDFNSCLIDYLLFYNTKRPHHSLNNQTPIDFMLKYLQEEYTKNLINYYTFKKCKMYVTYTFACQLIFLGYN